MGVLPDGRVFYFNGLEGQENATRNPLAGAAAVRNSQSRILDLRSGSPVWSAPSTPTGGGSNPDVRPRRSPTDEVETLPGVAGVPGRPGDGPVGSIWGEAGGPAAPPTAPPQDGAANDGDMFCAGIASLPDGRLLIAGGADWHHEAAVTGDEESGLPVEAGLPEVSGLRTTRIFDPRTDSFTETGPNGESAESSTSSGITASPRA